MRIIAGKLGSRQFKAPTGHKTHPMGDRVRGGLFATLGDIEGLTILDAFGGSGALSFEAVSRGASSAILLEEDRNAYAVVQQNISSLGLSTFIQPININARSWSAKNPTQLFDIVMCDPPYDHLQESLLERLSKHVKNGGIIVYSLPPYADIRLPKLSFQLVTTKSYGDASLRFYRKL